MALIDTEQLLQPIASDAPAGANLEYDPAFLALERTAQGKPEQQMGEVIVAAEPPDYAVVIRQASDLLERTKDLRVAVQIVCALAHRDAFQGLSEGLGLVHGLLERYWATVHPQLDPDDGNDPTMRVSALAALCTPEIVSSLRSAPLLRSRSFGAISLNDVVNASGDASRDNGAKEASTIEAAFQEADIDLLESLIQTLKDAARQLSGIEDLLEANAGTRGPDFTLLSQLLRQATLAVEQRTVGRRAEEPLEISSAPAEAQVQAPARTAVALTGEIQSREDVVRVLDKICAYYVRHEPSSPLPIILERCKRLVAMSFVDIVRELAPDALSQVERLAGKTE